MAHAAEIVVIMAVKLLPSSGVSKLILVILNIRTANANTDMTVSYTHLTLPTI